jgi:hypothetical protein
MECRHTRLLYNTPDRSSLFHPLIAVAEIASQNLAIMLAEGRRSELEVLYLFMISSSCDARGTIVVAAALELANGAGFGYELCRRRIIVNRLRVDL